MKNLVMESLYKIKSMEIKFRSIIVAHDMTKKQREECKLMVNEAKEKVRMSRGTGYTRSGVHRG